MVRDARIVDYIGRLGHHLAERAGGPAYPYTFDVADVREINAFTLPGGSIWIHRGAIEAAQNESQLAAVMAHEVAHASRRHAANQLSMAIAARWALDFMGAMLGNTGGAVTSRAVADALTNGAFRRFNQADETEADGAGVVIMRRAGWDARGMLQFLELLARTGRNQPRARGAVPRHASTARTASESRAKSDAEVSQRHRRHRVLPRHS